MDIPEDAFHWKREPFRRLEDPKAVSTPAPGTVSGKTAVKPYGIPAVHPEAPGIMLQGIMQADDRFYALINGRTVKNGDRIDGWSVVAIGRYRVTLKRDKDKQTIDIYEGSIDRGSR